MPEIAGLYEELKTLIEKYGSQSVSPSPVAAQTAEPIPEPAPEVKPQITFKDGEYHGI